MITALGDDFYEVEAVTLLEMRLMVFARNKLRPHIPPGSVHSAKEATGLAHVYGNKGRSLR